MLTDLVRNLGKMKSPLSFVIITFLQVVKRLGTSFRLVSHFCEQRLYMMFLTVHFQAFKLEIIMEKEGLTDQDVSY
jgi:hypothetical protein